MDEAAIRQVLIGILQRIAPELDAQALDENEALRDQIDLDSVDWLNVLVAISEQFKVDVPEADYEKLRTFADIVHYLVAR